MDDLRPVLVGAAQRTQHGVDPAVALGPLELMEACAREAADSCGGGARLLEAIDRVGVIDSLGWRWQNAPGLLAERLGAQPTECVQTHVGGNLPQRLLNESARRIAAGQSRAVLVAGAEAIYTVRRARRHGVTLTWSHGGHGEPVRFGDAKPGTSALENSAGLLLPTQIYPLFENALRARDGESIAHHRRRLGALMARFSAVAAQNPHAWFRDALDADEIATVTPTNRMIGFPYPKRMNAILDVDQGAAVLLTSAGFARSLGIPEERFVWWWGGGDAIEEAYFPTERPDLSRAPALHVAARAALAEAGVTIDEIDLLDLYSCFPVAVRMACEALGIAEDDPRGLTVTGGLAYAGGPGNAYTLMSLATMAGRLCASPGAIGLLTGVGWFLTKHSVGIFASRPPRPRETPRPEETTPAPPVTMLPGASGAATIVSFTVLHDREGAAERGIVVARLDSGERVLAHLPPDRALLESLEQTETVGRRGTLSEALPVSRFALD